MPRKTRSTCSCGFSYDAPTTRLLRKCPSCGATRVKKSKQKHMKALDLPREAFVAANGGYDGCWVCRELGTNYKGRVRDHWHTGPRAGEPRGIKCHYHNRLLGPHYTPELVAAYARYLNREEAA